MSLTLKNKLDLYVEFSDVFFVFKVRRFFVVFKSSLSFDKGGIFFLQLSRLCMIFNYANFTVFVSAVWDFTLCDFATYRIVSLKYYVESSSFKNVLLMGTC